MKVYFGTNFNKLHHWLTTYVVQYILFFAILRADLDSVIKCKEYGETTTSVHVFC